MSEAPEDVSGKPLDAVGVGHVLLQAGRSVLDLDGNLLFVAGPHPLLEGRDPFAKFCGAFG